MRRLALWEKHRPLDTCGKPVPESRLPNLIIAGVAKAGTTSLFNYLAQHPEICPSEFKETRYFDPLRFGRQVEPIETYASYFRHWKDERYAVEATPEYFQGGRRIASAIRETLPRARVVVILRQPSERCWSYFRFVKSRARIPEDMCFESYLDRCEELHARGTDQLHENRAFLGLTGGCYATWMGGWSAELGDRLKVIYFDDLSNDASGTVKDICGWLDIEDRAVDQFDLAVENKTEQVRSQTAQRLALAVNRRSERFFRRHPSTKRRLRGVYYLANREPSEMTMSDSAARRMADFYRPYEQRLARQLESMGVPQQPWLAGRCSGHFDGPEDLR